MTDNLKPERLAHTQTEKREHVRQSERSECHKN